MKGKDDGFDDLLDVVPLANKVWLDMDLKLDEAQPGEYKIFRNHSFADRIPPHMAKCRIIVILRDPLDVLCSYYDWLFKFNGVDRNHEHISIDDFYKINFLGEEGYLKYLDSWLGQKLEITQKALYICYENLVKKFDANLQKVEKFLGESLSKDEKSKIKEMTSFEYMKTNGCKFDIHRMREKLGKWIEIM